MLPKTLAYGSKVESSNARSYRTSIQPQNGTGTYNLNDTIIINIPTRNNLVMSTTESFLKFNVTVKAGVVASNYIRWDSCGAHGLIQRIRIFHGSNLLSDIDNYGMLAKILMDTQVATSATYGKFNILAGTRSDLYTDATTLQALQVNAGDRMNPIGTALAIATPVSQTYCLNLITLAGTLLHDRYFPLFACTSAPLRMEIQLVNNALIPLNCHTVLDVTAPLTLTNVEYVAQFMELSDNAMSIINSSLGGNPLQFTFNDYRNYAYNYALPVAAVSLSMPIPAKFSSLKSILVAIRDAANIGAATKYGYSSNRFGLLSYYFRIGSVIYPPKQPDSVPEFFSEVLKAIGSMSDLNYNPSIELDSYSQNVPAVNNESAASVGNVNSGSFYIGLDLENYVASDKTQIFAGHNSNTDDIYFVPTMNAAAAVASARFDAYAMFDSVLVFENGTCYVKF